MRLPNFKGDFQLEFDVATIRITAPRKGFGGFFYFFLGWRI